MSIIFSTWNAYAYGTTINPFFDERQGFYRGHSYITAHQVKHKWIPQIFFIALFMDLLGCIESILRARLLTSLPSLQMVSAVFRSKQQNLKSNTAKQANKMLMHGDISGLLFVCLLFNYLIFPMFCSDHLKFQASLKKSVIQSTSVRSDVATSLHFSYFPQAMLFQQHSIFNETPPNVIGSMQLSQNWQVTKETMYLI